MNIGKASSRSEIRRGPSAVRLTVSLAFAGLACSPLMAQVATEQTGAARQLEEIVVTARRQEELMQDVPVSVTALGPENIKQQDIVSSEQLAEFVPNLRIDISSRATNATIAIRGVSGVGVGADPTTSPGVGTYINGVFVPAGVANTTSLLDIERIEVLRGPQGVLFGQNTTGGAINIITRRPGPEAEGDLTVRTGSFNRRDVRLMLNAPIGENVYGRISAGIDRHDGHYRNLLLGTTHDDRNVRSVNASLRWQPSDQLTFDLTGQFIDQRENNRGGDCIFTNQSGYLDLFESLGGGDFSEACEESHAAGRYNFYSPWPMFVNNSQESIVAEFDWGSTGAVGPFEFLNLRGNYGWRELTYQALIDQHYNRVSPETRGIVGEDGQGHTLQNLEIIAESRLGRANLLLGANYFEDEGWVGSIDRCWNAYNKVQGTGESIECHAPKGFLFRIMNNNTTGSGPSVFFGNTGAWNSSFGVFTHAKIDITELIRVDVGARYTREQREFKNLEGDLTPVGGFSSYRWILNDNTVGLFGNNSETFSQVTPTASVNMTIPEAFGPLDAESMVYLLWAKGWNSGGHNSEVAATHPLLNPLLTFDAETLDNYELGIKTRLFDGRAQVNLAVFQMDFNDKQEQITIDNVAGQYPGAPPAFQIISNAAKAKITGVEVEFQALLGERWRFDGGFSQQKPRYEEWEDIDLETGQIVDLSDTRFNTHPEFSFTGNVNFEQNLPEGSRIRARVGAYWQSSTDPGVDQVSLIGSSERTACFRESYTTINGRVSWADANDRFDVSFFGRNLTSEDIMDLCSASAGRGRRTEHYEPKTTWGLEAGYRF